MKPSKIFNILDLARKVRKNNKTFNPLFVGPAGIGKSEIIQTWCKQNDLPFIDLRAAYLEAPDVIGFPSIEVVNGRQVTKHNIPEFWPQDGEGVLLLEEVNRGTTSVMNTFMQLLTDRKVHNYTLPDGWMVVGAVNPETAENDVNTMDVALKNRFEMFQVDYDKQTFVDFMKMSKYDPSIVMFVESGAWTFAPPENVGNAPGSKYVSPRTFSKLNNALMAGVDPEDELDIYESVLGKTYGKSFYAFRHNEKPVLLSHLKTDYESSIARLKEFSDPKNYKNALISITIKDIIDNDVDGEQISDELLAGVLLALPADQGPALVRELDLKRKDSDLLARLCRNFPNVKDFLKAKLKKDKKEK